MNGLLTVQCLSCNSIFFDFGRIMSELQETSQRILEVAGRRFLHYGYQKTAMNEIAKDLNMSTGNLYRFFPSKLAIAEAIALKRETTELSYLEQIVESNDKPKEKLRKFAFHIFKTGFDRFYESRKVVEIAQIIVAERPEFLQRRLGIERSLLSRILIQGIEAEYFAKPSSMEDTLIGFQCAIMRYRIGFMPESSDFELLAHELDLVLDLLISGLSARHV